MAFIHRSNLSKSLFISIIVCSIAVATSFQSLAKDVRESFNVEAGGKLFLRTDVGKLIIETHSKDEVMLEVEISGENSESFKVESEVDGDDVRIIGKMTDRKGRGWNRSPKVAFRITLPKEYNLEVHTSGGSIDIEDLIGDVDAHTSGGSIEVGSITGNVKLKTSGGSITTEAVHGELDAHTSGGSIRVTMAQQLTQDAELTTSGGSITAYLVEDIKIDIDASTSGGRVRSEFDVDGRIKKQSIRGEINGGGPRLELRTSGGSVSIKSL